MNVSQKIFHSIEGNGKAFCLVCKELIPKRYEVHVKDPVLNGSIQGHICRHCYTKFVESNCNRGLFKVSKMWSWLKDKGTDIF